jgi:Domain of unknown function (DUF4157)
MRCRSTQSDVYFDNVWRKPSAGKVTVYRSTAVCLRSGRSLDPATCVAATGLFGHDFTRVRVHDDEPAAASAARLGARAYRRKGSTAEMKGAVPWGNIVAVVEHTADPSQPPHLHVVRPPTTGKRIEHGGVYTEPFVGTRDQHLTYWLTGAPPVSAP